MAEFLLIVLLLQVNNISSLLPFLSLSWSILGQYIQLHINDFILVMSVNLYEILLGFSFAVYKALPLYRHIVLLAHRLKKVIHMILFFCLSISHTCFFIFWINSSFSSFFTSYRVTANSWIVLHNNMDNSFSSLKAAITVSSNSPENFGVILDKPSVFPRFFDYSPAL